MEKDAYTYRESVTKTYKRSTRNKVYKINIEEENKIVTKLKIDDRVQQFHKAEVFITVKEDKDSFINFPTFRLSNPSKSDIDKISKSILDKINNMLVEKTKVNQWENSANTIKWFKSIPNKKGSPFVYFNVENVYPSISEKLLSDAISYARLLIDKTEVEYSITMHSRKMFLFQNSKAQVKKDNNEDFDVPMGCYDGPEICQLVGSFILNQLGSVIDKNDIGSIGMAALEFFVDSQNQ